MGKWRGKEERAEVPMHGPRFLHYFSAEVTHISKPCPKLWWPNQVSRQDSAWLGPPGGGGVVLHSTLPSWHLVFLHLLCLKCCSMCHFFFFYPRNVAFSLKGSFQSVDSWCKRSLARFQFLGWPPHSPGSCLGRDSCSLPLWQWQSYLWGCQESLWWGLDSKRGDPHTHTSPLAGMYASLCLTICLLSLYQQEMTPFHSVLSPWECREWRKP